MKFNICASFDIKTRTYDLPFMSRSLAEVEREFSDLKKNPETKWGKYPTDYEVRHLGYFDDEDFKGNQFFEEPIVLNG